MKTIDAYVKLKLFLKRVEIIDTSLRVSIFTEKLKSSKDYFVSLEELKISTALKTLAECFKREALKKENKIYSNSFLFWSKGLFEKAEKFENLSPYLETFKEIIDTSVRGSNNLKENDTCICTCSVIEGVKLYIEDDSNLKRPILMFELFVIQKMTQKELTPSIEFEEISLN